MDSLFHHCFEVKFDLVAMFFLARKNHMILSALKQHFEESISLFYPLDNRTNSLPFNFPNAFPRSNLPVSVSL